MNDIKEGDIVKIVRDKNYPWLIGRIAKVIKSDTFGKIKVSFDSNWQGYFTYTQLLKIEN